MLPPQWHAISGGALIFRVGDVAIATAYSTFIDDIRCQWTGRFELPSVPRDV